MADHKNSRRALRPRSAPKVVSPRNNVNVSLPFSKLTIQEPERTTARDWISLAGLVISVIGFGVVIWRSARLPAPVAEHSQS